MSFLKSTIPFLISLLVLVVSCSKSEWKKPTDVTFMFDINKEKTMNGNLYFTGGEVILRELTFDGKRVQGEDVYFEKEFDDGLDVLISSSVINSQLVFDIPQGTYTSIRIDFEAEESEDKLITIKGNYTNSNNKQFPVILEIEDIGIYDKIAKTKQGETEMNLVANQPSKAAIIFDPVYWFENISSSELDEAQTTFINGVETILISENSNEDLHDVIHDIIENKSSHSIQIIFS